MNLSDINPNLPCLRPLTFTRSQKRRMSCSTNTKSSHSSSTESKHINALPVLIQLCIYPDENYACQTMKILFSSQHHYSPNVCDEFGCNLLMYALRYQRYQLFDFLLNEISLDLNFRSKDRQGNTILHYAIVYANNETHILQRLIEYFNQVGIDVDERNMFGFTPLLLAVYCGRYDLALALLSETETSPFVRDFIQLHNIMDYLEIDAKQRNSRQFVMASRESTRLRIQLHQTLLPQSETPSHQLQHHPYKNFFQNVFPQAVQDRSGTIRSSIINIFRRESFSEDLTHLILYLNRRYPRIQTSRRLDKSPHHTTTTKLLLQRENSNVNVHQIISLFDPDLRPKATLPPPPPPPPPPLRPLTKQITQIVSSPAKTPITFKRLGTKLTVLAALSRPQTAFKTDHSIVTTAVK